MELCRRVVLVENTHDVIMEVPSQARTDPMMDFDFADVLEPLPGPQLPTGMLSLQAVQAVVESVRCDVVKLRADLDRVLAQPEPADTLQVKTAEVQNSVVGPSRTVWPTVQPHPLETPSVTATAPDNSVLLPVLDIDLDDFIPLLVDSDISTDAMWDATDTVFPIAPASRRNSRCKSPSSHLGE